MNNGTTQHRVTYTVREPGHAYWWEGYTIRQARKALREAHNAGLSRARLYRERNGIIAAIGGDV